MNAQRRRLVLLGGLGLSGCLTASQRGAFLRVDVAVWSEPEGAAVYFVPTYVYTSDLLADSIKLRQYRVGSTNTTTSLRELSYVVVFDLAGEREVLYDVQVVSGQPNRVGIRFARPPP